MVKRFEFRHIVVLSLSIGVASLSGLAYGQAWKDLGRPATPAEVKAWDIDVRGDFKGIPKGSGTVAKGAEVWEGKCASCHGSFGEANSVFTPIVGGTTAEDIKTGHTAALAKGDVPQRTTLMKLSKLSTMWDYINRAMPWNAPKTLTVEEVYAVTAYILNMGEIVPSDFTLSDKNIAEVQAKLPNRNGMVLRPDMWKVKGKGDVVNVACMKNCATDAKVESFLPDVARNAHGNLAEQNRFVGEAIGIDTTKPATAKPAPVNRKAAAASVAAAPAAAAGAKAGQASGGAGAITPQISNALKENGCAACHGLKGKIVGPGFNEMGEKYKGKANIEAYLVGKIKNGGSGVWGPIPMPPQPNLKEADAKAIAKWISAGAN